MRKKTLTTDCASCETYMKIDDDNNFTCSWGKGKKPKILEPHKGKKPIQCKLKRD